MTDADTTVTFDKKKTLKIIGVTVLLTLFIGATIITITVAAFPDNRYVGAVASGFVGGACKPIEQERDEYKNAWSCIEGGAAATGTDISKCAAKLHAGADPK